MIKQTFLKGKLNKSTDERVFPKGEMRDAVNIRTISSEGSDSGTAENCLGNKKLTDYNLTNASIIGELEDESNLQIYYFVTSDEKDMVIEYNKPRNELETEFFETVLESSIGGVLNFSKNNLITGINKIINGKSEKDLLAWVDDRNNNRIVNINDAKSYGLDGFSDDDISLIKKPPRFAPNVKLTFTNTGGEDNLKDLFLSFAYRYRYENGFISAISSFTNYQFEPKGFDLDYSTMQNEGMSNLYNAVNIFFDTGEEKVIGIDLLYKESISNTLYIIEKFNKEEENWGNNENKRFLFSNDKRYAALPIDELNRAFDNVPRKSKSQELIGSRLSYGNNLEGYDMVADQQNPEPLKIDFTLSLESQSFVYFEDIENISIDVVNLANPGSLRFNIGAQTSNQPFLENSTFRFLIDLIEIDESGGEDDRKNGFFTSIESYVLPRDYTDAEDLFNPQSGNLEDWIENDLSNIFFSNYISDPPINSTGIISQTGFIFTSVNGAQGGFVILAPKITYEIDNGNSPSVDYRWDFIRTLISDIFGTIVENPFTFTTLKILLPNTTGETKSIKSDRSVEAGLIYLDPYGRKSTVEVCSKNTVFVKPELSSFSNKVIVNINHKPPYWADRYKLVFKENKGEYETIFANVFYNEDGFVWVKLEGENIGKVKQGDSLVVKGDINGPLNQYTETKVLAIESKEKNFIEDNQDGDIPIIEFAGLYMKIKANTFDVNLNGISSSIYRNWDRKVGAVRQTFTTPNFTEVVNDDEIPINILAGTSIDFFIEVHGDGSAPNGYSDYTIDKIYQVQADYIWDQNPIDQNNLAPIVQWFNAEVVDLGSLGIGLFGDGNNNNRGQGWDFTSDGKQFWIKQKQAVGNFNFYEWTTSIKFTIRLGAGTAIFETIPKKIDTNIFYETEETFEIINGEHLGNRQNQSFTTVVTPAIIESSFFNCYSFGNGLESYKYRDELNAKKLGIDLRPSAVSSERYSETRRFADISYSEPYNEDTNINGLNEFNLSKGNFKDDIEKKFGSIQKLYSRDTDLVVFQEDKVSRVLFGKDVISNADGTGNVSTIDSVLAQQVPFTGEYGISKCPESFAKFGSRIYFNDPKRGTPLRLSVNGITEISLFDMEDFFKDIFIKHPEANYQGGYDPYFDEYVLAIQIPERGNFAIGFSEKTKGWTSLYNFYPEGMVGLSNDFYSFKNGEFYIHNSPEVPRNNFYGEQFKSSLTTILNDMPSNDKIFKSLILESNSPWKAYIQTNFANSVINLNEFKRKESKYFAYIRNNEDISSLRGNVAQGIGNLITASGFECFFNSVPVEARIGDNLFTQNEAQLVDLGVITEITENKITVDAFITENVNGNFCFVKKQTRIEGGDIRGYYAEVTLENEDTVFAEIFAVNSVITRSDLFSNEKNYTK